MTFLSFVLAHSSSRLSNNIVADDGGSAYKLAAVLDELRFFQIAALWNGNIYVDFAHDTDDAAVAQVDSTTINNNSNILISQAFVHF